MARVSLEAITKRYDNGFQAVNGVTVDIASGEFIALLGPSGCGKTTTLRMVAGLEDITSGTLTIDGRAVNDVPPRDRDVAMVFQSYALYPHMTVRDNMAFGLRIRNMDASEIAKRVESAAAALGLSELLDRKPGQMSGGQRQRVAMGRAIVRQPKVFLFDEPLSNLDARLRTHMRMELGRLHRELGATSIYVTHDQVEAMTLADRIVLMKDGIVQQIGAPMELYERPSNVFVAGFIGHPTMNLLDGRIESGMVHLPGWQMNVGNEVENLDVKVGLRPHDVTLCDPNLATEKSPSLTVQFAEPMGHETLVHLENKTLRLRALVHGEAPQPGMTFSVSVEPSSMHLFHGTTEERI